MKLEVSVKNGTVGWCSIQMLVFSYKYLQCAVCLSFLLYCYLVCALVLSYCAYISS